MAKIIFLGTAAAVASASRDNTSLLFIEDKGTKFLIDCPGSPVNKLSRVNIDFRQISQIILTHSHPDHLYGLASLLHSQYELKNRVDLYGIRAAFVVLKKLISAFRLNQKKYPRLSYHPLLLDSHHPFFESDEIAIFCFSVRHAHDSLGLKFYIKNSKVTVVYSGDTAPCPSLIKEAEATSYLIHDCLCPSRFEGKIKGLNVEHTSSLSLGQLAKKAKVESLIPIHFSTELDFSMEEVISEIRKNFPGRIIIPADLDILELTPPPS